MPSMYESSLLLLGESVCHVSVFSWQNTASFWPASFCNSRPNLPITLVSLDFLSLPSSPLWGKGNLFLVLVLEGLEGLHSTIQLQFLQHMGGWDVDLGYCDIELFASERNRDHSAIFEIEPKYCISHSFVDYLGYSISSKWFLPT